MRCPHCHDPSGGYLIRRMTHAEKWFCRACRKTFFVSLANFTTDGGGEPLPEGKVGFMVFDHQGKEKKFVEALNHDGKYFQMSGGKNISFVLTDSDILGRRYKLEQMRNGGINHFFVYPHAARPDLTNDIHREWAFTSAHLVTTRGHSEIMEAYGYSRPLVPVGWSLCPIRPFQPREEPRNVLFMPIHPRCSEIDQQVNRAAFNRLEKLARAGDICLAVRYINDLGKSGLERVQHPNIQYTAGFMDQGYEQIDNADMVVAHQTALYLAVARGVPAVGLAETLPTHIQEKNKGVLYARNWKSYEHLVRFPFDILEADNVLRMLQKAVSSDRDIRDWRNRLIGEPFDGRRFIENLEKFL